MIPSILVSVDSYTQLPQLTAGDTRGFANLGHLNVSYPGILPGIDETGPLDVTEDQLRERLPTSLKKLTLNRLFQTSNGFLMAADVAALKIDGTLPHLDVIVMICTTNGYAYGGASISQP